MQEEKLQESAMQELKALESKHHEAAPTEQKLQESAPQESSARDFRPILHFTPKSGWTNDPNGLVFVDGLYHLFYQHYPDDVAWGPMHWGHAVSRDLVRWKHQPVALAPDALGMIFSGSAVWDGDNTSGFGAADAPPLVAMFTHHGETEQQSIAWSTDGIHFTKHDGNPVIPNPVTGVDGSVISFYKDFRDPKIFRNPIHGGWSVVVATGDRVTFYASNDLRSWRKTGEFGPDGNPCPGIWECPDLFPLTAPDGSIVWVLIGSMILPEGVNPHRTQYLLGSFDGDVFRPFTGGASNAQGVEPGRSSCSQLGEPRLPSAPDQSTCPDSLQQIHWLDAGYDNYAAVSFDNNAERILIGWAAVWAYAGKTPTQEFRGAMTLARRARLVETMAGLRLAQEPVLPALPIQSVRMGAGSGADSVNHAGKRAGGNAGTHRDTAAGWLSLGMLKDGDMFPEGVLYLKIRARGEFCISLGTAAQESTSLVCSSLENSFRENASLHEETRENPSGERIRFGLEDGEWFMDRSEAGDRSFSDAFAHPDMQRSHMKRLLDGPVEMEAILDVSILEAFADGGVFACSQLVFPSKPYRWIRIEGEAEIIGNVLFGESQGELEEANEDP